MQLSDEDGLSAQEARERLHRYGGNELPRGGWSIAWLFVIDPVNVLVTRRLGQAA